MLGDSNLVGFAPTTDPQAAKAFYSGVLGLKLVAEDPFALTYSANGTTLRVTTVEAFTPQPFTVLGWWVDDPRAALEGLRARGVRFERFEGMDQDSDGFWTPPGSRVAVAWFKDPAGNTLSITGFVG